MRIVEKKFTRYLAILFAPRETVKLNKNFSFFFFISRVVSRDIFRVIRVIFDRNSFFIDVYERSMTAFGEHFELIN